tara:strand:+ start:73 stop:1140 length:1068 start_codon:yes stop_codon:yes gene_type:complete
MDNRRRDEKSFVSTIGEVTKLLAVQVLTTSTVKAIGARCLPDVEPYAAHLAINMGMAVISRALSSFGDTGIRRVMDELFARVSKIDQVANAETKWRETLKLANTSISHVIETNVISHENFIRQIVKTTTTKESKESSWVMYCASMMTTSIISGYILVVFSHLVQTLDSACIDAFVSWTMNGKLNLNNTFAKLNGPRILACISSLKKLKLPISVSVIDFMATMLSSLGFLKERTNVSMGIGIAFKGRSPQSLRMIGNIITATPNLLSVMNIAKNILMIQMHVLNDSATVVLGPSLSFDYKNEPTGDNRGCHGKNEFLEACKQQRGERNLCTGDPCDSGLFPCTLEVPLFTPPLCTN